jgi:hypothetical protein
MLFQVLQFLFGSILLFDIPKDLLDIFLEHIIVSKHILGYIPCYNNNLSFNCLVVHEIVDISLNLVKNYTVEITNNIYYFSWLAIKQVLVEEDIDIYRYKEVIEFSSISIKDIRCFDSNSIFLYYKY